MARWTPRIVTALTVLLSVVWLASGRWSLIWTDFEPDGSSAVAVLVGGGRFTFGRASDAAMLALWRDLESGPEIVTRPGYGLNWGFPDRMTADYWAMPLWVPVVTTGAAAGEAWRRRAPRRRKHPLGAAGLVRRALEAVTVLLVAMWLVSAWWSVVWFPTFSGGWRGAIGLTHGQIGLGITGRSWPGEIEYLGFELRWWFDWRVNTTYVPTERILIIPIWTWSCSRAARRRSSG